MVLGTSRSPEDPNNFALYISSADIMDDHIKCWTLTCKTAHSVLSHHFLSKISFRIICFKFIFFALMYNFLRDLLLKTQQTDSGSVFRMLSRKYFQSAMIAAPLRKKQFSRRDQLGVFSDGQENTAAFLFYFYFSYRWKYRNMTSLTCGVFCEGPSISSRSNTSAIFRSCP